MRKLADLLYLGQAARLISLFMQYNRAPLSPANAFQLAHARLLLDSHRALLKRDLLESPSMEIGRALYEAPMVVLAHDTAVDPVFFYGNLAAQRLFELNWNELVQLPSRFSAEPVARDERQRLLDLVTSQGFIDNYSGVRIAKSGKRFLIKQATVWNLLGHDGQVLGQAAAFDHWVPVASPESGYASDFSN